MKFIVILYSFASFYTLVAQDSNFTRIALPDGASIEKPKSWSVTVDFNQSFDELMESNLDGIDPRSTIINTKGTKTQLIAAGRFANTKASLLMVYVDNDNFGQHEMGRLTDAEKAATIQQIENFLKSTVGVKAVASFDKIGEYHIIITKSQFEGEADKITVNYQIPMGKRIVQFQFICETKFYDVWKPLFKKIVGSYVPPNN